MKIARIILWIIICIIFLLGLLYLFTGSLEWFPNPEQQEKSCIISVVMIPVLISLNFVINYIFAGYSNIGYYFVHHILATIAYTFVTVPVFYGINRVLSRGFNDYIY